MDKIKLNLGEKMGTLSISNDFWIKKFGNGVKLKKKGQGEIALDIYDTSQMLLYLRKHCRKYNCMSLLTAIDLSCVWQKYPETKEFITRLLTDEVTDEEKLKIHDFYMTKNKIIDGLEDGDM